MGLKEKIAEKAGIDADKIPARFQIIGDIFLAKMFFLDKNDKKQFALAVKEILPYIKTVCEIKEIKGELRRPKVVKILGKGLETIHKENGIFYKLDVSKIMFSKGNHSERRRLIDIISNHANTQQASHDTNTQQAGYDRNSYFFSRNSHNTNSYSVKQTEKQNSHNSDLLLKSHDTNSQQAGHDTNTQQAGHNIIIDMFAGIGYFSLGLSKKCKKIYAIEKNPVAFKYLKENIKLNKINNIVAIKGDCKRIASFCSCNGKYKIYHYFHCKIWRACEARSLCSEKSKIANPLHGLAKTKADCVLMGYFPNTQKYLPSAFRFLGNQGTIIYHNLYNRQDRTKPIEDVEKAAKKAGYKIVSFKQRTVKEYNSRKDHVVCDVGVERFTK